MGDRSLFPSQVVVSDCFRDVSTVLDFMEKRFPLTRRDFWESRMKEGLVFDNTGQPVSPDEPCTPGLRIFYYREVQQEIKVPFTEEILHHDDHLLVAFKPHFLPVTPSGRYVNHCLLNRLKTSTGNVHLTPIHRIDRETAGIVVFSVNPETRGAYQRLFMEGAMKKTYEAVARYRTAPPEETVVVENRIVKGEPFFRMKTEAGPPNARSLVRCLRHQQGLALFHIEPVTGKKHQIRLHLSGLGFGIVNDTFYPVLYPEAPPDFVNPLQLLARSLSFRDPLTQTVREFRCSAQLALASSC